MLQRLRAFLTLGVIIGPLPNNIVDGTIIDAVPVMANYNWIVSQVNANVPPLVPSVSPMTTWTPVLQFGGASTGITYAAQLGQYVKIGQMVFFTFGVTLTSKGSATGDAGVSGLPFPVNSQWLPSSNATLVVSPTLITFDQGVSAYLAPGQSLLALVNIKSANAATILQETAFTNSSGFSCSGFYAT